MKSTGPTPIALKSGGSGSALPWLYAASGFGSLALETLWIREITLRTGSTLVAASLVVGTFFFFGALGNLLGGWVASRTRKPLGGYAGFEASAAISALFLFLGADVFQQVLSQFPWLSGSAIGMAVTLVGLPSLLSGASFPLLSEYAIRSVDERVVRGGVLYGANLIGAGAGVLAGAVVLPWTFGMRGAFFFAAVILLVGALLAFILARNAGAKTDPQLQCDEPTSPPNWSAMALFFIGGALSLATQGLLISWARQILQGSVFALSGVLATFIVGLGAGSLLAAWLRKRGRKPAAALAWFALAAAAQLAVLPSVGRVLTGGMPPSLGDNPWEMFTQATGWSVLFLLPLATCLGTIFPLAWDLWATSTPHAGRELGRNVATNKLGAALGVWLGVFLLLPTLGLSSGTRLLAAAYAVLALGLLLVFCRIRARNLLIGAAALAVLALVWAFVPQTPLGVEPHEKAVATYEGAYGPVTVVEDSVSGSRRILLNTRQHLNGTGRALSSQLHQAWIPLLFAPSTERVAVIGMASGITTSGVLDFPVQELTTIELVPEVLRAARDHFQPWNNRVFSDSRVHQRVGDGRQVLRTLPDVQDVVICDLLFPQEDGAAHLYSQDFFTEVRDRLSNRGIFCLWLPCYQLDGPTADILLRTFAGVFPYAVAVRSNYDPLQPVIGLVGSRSPLPMGRAFLEEKLSATPDLQQRSPFFRSPDHAWLSVVGDLHPTGAGEGSVTTDDRPVLAYLGPVAAGSRDRLVGMVFAKWSGERFNPAALPSVEHPDVPQARILDATRASRAYFIAAVAESVIEGDIRPEAVRLSQAARWLARAHEAHPSAQLPAEARGR